MRKNSNFLSTSPLLYYFFSKNRLKNQIKKYLCKLYKRGIITLFFPSKKKLVFNVNEDFANPL